MKQTASEVTGAVFVWYILEKICKTYEKEFGKDGLNLRDVVLYLKCSKDVEVQNTEVLLKDIASVECTDNFICDRCKAIIVHRFHGDKKRAVISVMKVIQLISREWPEVLVQSIGETDILIEQIKVTEYKGWKQWWKVALVCCISFFGTAFTIIAYNNDISITGMFERMYGIFGVEPTAKLSLLELSYSVGLAVGIIIFFNHIGGRRITKDPTPIEVSMRNYERDVNQALIETADREGMEEDV